MSFLVTRLPSASLPLMARSAKFMSNWSTLSRCLALRVMRSTSASPLGLAENQTMREPSSPLVASYSLSRVRPGIAKRFI